MPVKKSIRDICGFPDFPRNAAPNSAEYHSERPEMTSHDEKSRTAKTTKGNNTYENDIKKQNGAGRIALWSSFVASPKG
jgi:hypothetical protein